MKWQGRRESGNVRRGGGGAMIPIGGGGLILILLLTFLLGGNPADVLEQVGGNQPAIESRQDDIDPDFQSFISVILADTEDVWHAHFEAAGQDYREPTLVLFNSGMVNTACGAADARMGPFYCPGDETIYLSQSFYRELSERYGAPGDFAMAYVVAHEVGHHVQKQRGILDKVHALADRLSEADYNKYSVALELQADYYAGVVAHEMEHQNYLDPGDIEEAMQAAAAVGDDRLQRQATGHVNPDAFTHGTSAERREWFMRGYKYHDFAYGDTFSARGLPALS